LYTINLFASANSVYTLGYLDPNGGIVLRPQARPPFGTFPGPFSRTPSPPVVKYWTRLWRHTSIYVVWG